MISNQNSNDSSTFSLFTQKELEQQKLFDEINFILDKYNILENENQFISSTEHGFLHFINYISKLNNKKIDIPNDLENLFLENVFFKEQINIILENRLFNITKSDSTSFFKDLTTILNILSIGSKQNIFTTYSYYDLDSIANLFRFYEQKLQTLFIQNTELYEVFFNSYIILLNTFTQLCSINSLDIIRKKMISPLIELMLESINITKFTIKLNDNNLSKINNIQGKHLYYFSHIEEIFIDSNNISRSFEIFYLILLRQEDGYSLSKNNNFGNENILDNQEFLIFKKYSSIFILNLLDKFKKKLDSKLYFDNEYFQAIIKFYYKNFTQETNKEHFAKNIHEFEVYILNSLLYNYSTNSNFSHSINYHLVIEDFIFSSNQIDNTNLETIYQILQFADDIEDYKFNHISQLLIDSEAIKNDYHEFFKLCILDLTINKLQETRYSFEVENLLQKIITYVETNKIASHLLSIYSKIYLSLSLYYSKNIDIDKAKNLYSIYVQINGFEILENEYLDINSQILNNIQKKFNFSNKKELLVDFLNNKQLQLNENILFLQNKINTSKNMTYIDVVNSLKELISNQIFHGLCQVDIFNTDEDIEKNSNENFEEYALNIDKKCVIKLYFLGIYEKNFTLILENNKYFIQTNICKILKQFKPQTISYDYYDEDKYEINY